MIRCEECGLLISPSDSRNYEALVVCRYCRLDFARFGTEGVRAAEQRQYQPAAPDPRPSALDDVAFDDGEIPDFQLGFRNLDPDPTGLEWVDFDVWLEEQEE